MAVVINEVDHVAPAAPDRGSSGAAPQAASATSSEAMHRETLTMLRREAQRTARLWAD